MDSGDSTLSHDLEESKQTFTLHESKSSTDYIPSVTVENEPTNLSKTQIPETISNDSLSQSENEIEDKDKCVQGEECYDCESESNTKHSNQNESDNFSPAKETQSDGEEDEDDDFESADEGEIDEEELKNQESKMSEEEKEVKISLNKIKGPVSIYWGLGQVLNFQCE